MSKNQVLTRNPSRVEKIGKWFASTAFAQLSRWTTSVEPMSRDTASQSSPARVVKNEPRDKISAKAAGKRKAPVDSDEEKDQVMQNGHDAPVDDEEEEEEEEVVGSSRKRARNGNPPEEEDDAEAEDPDLENAAELFLRDIPLARDQNGSVSLTFSIISYLG